MRQPKSGDSSGRCQGLTKAGKPCRAAATEGGLCFFHANPAKAIELGRIGGSKNRREILNDVDELPKLDSVRAVREAVAQMIVDLHQRRLHPSAAAGLAQLSNTLIRAIEVADLEAELERVRETEKSILRSIEAEASKA